MIQIIAVPYEGYNGAVDDLLTELYSVEKSKIAYITLTKTKEYLLDSITAKPKRKGQLFMIDAATKMLKKGGNVKNDDEAAYIRHHNLLDELDNAEKLFLEKGKFTNIVFDSISTLLSYYPAEEIVDFLIRFLNKYSILESDIYLFCNKGQVNEIIQVLEKRGVIIMQEQKNVFILQTYIDTLVSVIHDLEQSIILKYTAVSQKKYFEVSNLYKKIATSDVERHIKKQIYERCMKCFKMVKILKVDYAKELNSSKTILALIQNDDYEHVAGALAKQFSGKKLLYISYNKTYDLLAELFSGLAVDYDNFLFIDAITKRIRDDPEKHKNLKYVKHSDDLTKMSLLISERFDLVDYVIFDSISAILHYVKPNELSLFISTLVNKIRNNSKRSIFFCINDKKHSKQIGEISMFFDKVIDVSG